MKRLRSSSKIDSPRMAAHSPQVIALALHRGNFLTSSKNLDFCLIALCSCILSILCHSALNPPASLTSATDTPISQASSSSNSSNSLAIKLLPPTSSRPEVKEEDGN